MRLIIIYLLTFFVFANDYFPGDNWETRDGSSLGLDEAKIDKLFKLTFEDSATMSAVLIKDGYIVKEKHAEGFDIWNILVNCKKFLCCINWNFS